MALFAPVCPIHILDSFAQAGILGDYHLPLAHDVLRHPEEYRRIFKDEMDVVILDNSVIELGTAVNIDVIAQAAEIVCANVIVLPDVLLDTDATIHSCMDAIEPWSRTLDDVLGEGEWSFMMVPQGKTVRDFARCAEVFAGIKEIGWWGVPRNFNIHGLGSRREAVEIVNMLDPDNQIHLLGFSDNILDDMLSARHPAVYGIDSAVPIRAASLNYGMSLSLDAKLPPRGEWWDDPKTCHNELMDANLERVREWVKGY